MFSTATQYTCVVRTVVGRVVVFGLHDTFTIDFEQVELHLRKLGTLVICFTIL